MSFGTSTKTELNPTGRPLHRKTLALREGLMTVLDALQKPVTCRQVFYQATVQRLVEKAETGYRKVQRQLLEMRRESVISYGYVADNTRWMRKPDTYGSLADVLEVTAHNYRASVWAELDTHVELWCEKDALASVLYQETHRFDVPLMVARGYSSESFAYESADAINNSGKERVWIYYVGDFDPSGWDMSENLKAKLIEFVDSRIDLQFIRLAVTPDQVNTWNLPSRPTKKTDTRCKRFFELFGKDAPSIELDAIHPNQLRQLVRDAIEQHLPDGWLARIEQEEQAARETLADIAQHWSS